MSKKWTHACDMMMQKLENIQHDSMSPEDFEVLSAVLDTVPYIYSYTSTKQDKVLIIVCLPF